MNRLEGKEKEGIGYTDNIDTSAGLEPELHTASNRYVLKAYIQAAKHGMTEVKGSVVFLLHAVLPRAVSPARSAYW